MGTDLFALRKPKVQLNMRDDSDDDEYTQSECIDSYHISYSWINSDVNSWPKCLQQFWWKIHDYDSAQFYAKKIRKYYPNDINLLRFASWLETFDEDIIFELSI